MKKSITFLFGLGMLALVSCGGGNKSADTTEATDTTKAVVTEEAAPAMDLTAGEAIYNGKGTCFTCHQANGQGLAPAFPPLANADYLLENKYRAIHQTIHGSQEPITVNGTTYPGKVMTVVQMTDQEVADVVNYILNSWGNNGGTVSVEEVTKVRAEGI